MYDPTAISMEPDRLQDRDGSLELTITQSEFGEPVPGEAKVLLDHYETNLCVSLESPRREEYEWPDFLIERHAGKWYVVVHPNAGDPCAFISIYDDGRILLEDPDESREDVELADAKE